MSGSARHPSGDAVHFEVSREFHGRSLRDFLDALADGPLDRRLVLAAARDGSFQLNGEAAGPAVTLRSGDLLESRVAMDSLARKRPDDLVLLHEDDDVLIASKPSGLPFDASRAGSGRSAIERLVALSPEGGRPRPGHRLDKDTSGASIPPSSGPRALSIIRDRPLTRMAAASR